MAPQFILFFFFFVWFQECIVFILLSNRQWKNIQDAYYHYQYLIDRHKHVRFLYISLSLSLSIYIYIHRVSLGYTPSHTLSINLSLYPYIHIYLSFFLFSLTLSLTLTHSLSPSPSSFVYPCSFFNSLSIYTSFLLSFLYYSPSENYHPGPPNYFQFPITLITTHPTCAHMHL